MARHESDREDLLREATALLERVELAPLDDAHAERITAGFRVSGAMSIYFGADPVYQFNATGELRRAHCDGRLFKAVRGRLVSLRRTRQHGEVQLLRHGLGVDEQAAFLARMSDRLRSLAAQLDRGDYRVIGQVPPDADVLRRLCEWLSRHNDETIAKSPHVR